MMLATIEKSHVPVVELQEWGSASLADLELCDADRNLLSRWPEHWEQRLVIEELKSGIRVQASSWVGVIRLSSLEVRVQPKLAGEHLGLLKMLDYTSGLDAFRRLPGDSIPELEGSNLFDLIAVLFAEACEQLIRRGLLSDYRQVEADLPVVRGRFLPAEQFMKHYAVTSKLECRFDEQLSDIDENRIVFAALSACRAHISGDAVRSRISRLESLFAGICSKGLSLAEWPVNRLEYNRMNEHYRLPHELAFLILRGLSVSDIFAHGGVRCFAFLLDMNALFEQFVGRWLSNLLADTKFRLRVQHRDGSVLWDLTENKRYGSVRPDFLIRKPGFSEDSLPLDAKYKLYDEKRLIIGDVYQMFLYAHAFSGKSSNRTSRALLIYPSSDRTPKNLRLAVQSAASQPEPEIYTVGVHIPSVLAGADSETRNLAAEEIRSILEKHFAPDA